MKKARGLKSGFPVFLSARYGKNPGNPPDIGYRLLKTSGSWQQVSGSKVISRDGGESISHQIPGTSHHDTIRICHHVCTVQITSNTTHHKA